MYGEYFDIPPPDELVFVSSFSGGEVLRSGCTFRRGHGKVVYFSPGDQEYPVYHHADIRRVIANSVSWAAPTLQAPPVVHRASTGWFSGGSDSDVGGLT
jgi:trehalose utilization protein